MNILIIGLGYAGTRFLNAFNNLNKSEYNNALKLSYTSRTKKDVNIQFYNSVKIALDKINPDIVVVSTTDGTHADVLSQLNGYKGFVICEKPLINKNDDINDIVNALHKTSGFCMDMVERYSEMTTLLKNHIKKNRLNLIRSHFIWGKNRINDKRPTSGVTSEIVHPLDLIQYITNIDDGYQNIKTLSVGSDFSVSGDDVLDSAAIRATLQQSLITGYSSFTNIVRQRTVDFIFSSSDEKLVYAHLTYDTPNWDNDALRVWERDNNGDKIIIDRCVESNETQPELKAIQKLSRLVKDVVGFVHYGKKPMISFTNLESSINLQKLLNEIEGYESFPPTIKYVLGNERIMFNDESDLERLG